MKNKIEYLECQCSCPEHSIKFVLDIEDNWPTELFIYTQLYSYDSFFKRCWNAIKYIFKREKKWGYWGETILKIEDADKLIDLLNEYKRRNDEKGSN